MHFRPYLFFQAEDGIRDVAVTGVQTCALPILADGSVRFLSKAVDPSVLEQVATASGGGEVTVAALKPPIVAQPVAEREQPADQSHDPTEKPEPAAAVDETQPAAVPQQPNAGAATEPVEVDVEARAGGGRFWR